MSVLHHSAYDLNLMGIDPDGVIHINRDLLEIHDGPTLRHALQELDHIKMREPEDPTRRPNRDFLAGRFTQFTAVA
jgi:putative restriction endonuclease